ncbi:MAG: hypothetical protein NC342_08125 [Pseudoflavonifractor sp.]|nr:hypothetical protein [Alloprevotella sp.]MCM1117487.1 hypothetical protein [Pseudoflavonifractor sp.]
MKTYILTGGAAAMLLALTSCSENYWNNHELDGFKVPEITDVKTIDYTLTAADYSTLAANATNKALAGSELASQLKAVGTQGYFTEKITARDYVPALLSDPSFPYFTLTDGSAIKLTYQTAVGLPDDVALAAASETYAVTDEDYQSAWGSSNDYVDAFTPSKPASKFIPSLLAAAYPDAKEGTLVVANYSQADTDPVFNATPEPPSKEYVMSSTIGDCTEGDQIDITGYVTAICASGFITADASGAIFVYMGNSFDASAYAVGNQVTVSGNVSSYNRGLQISGTSATIEVTGTGAYAYPAPYDFTAAALDGALSREGAELAIYGKMTGTVAVSGNNINILVAGTETAQGGVYYATDAQKALLVDGTEVTVTGYFIAIAGKRYCNFVATEITPASPASKSLASRSGLEIASREVNTMYRYTGGRWNVASEFTVLAHSDYQAMGQRYDNLSNDSPALFIPKYADVNFPYAVEGDTRYIVYNYYASSTTTRRCDYLTYNGSTWAIDNGIVTETSQFVMTGGKWIYDPNVTITLPAGKGIEISTLYYQACVDWVAANIDKPTGATYVTSYGNNEYYTGASAYQGNVDLRASSARAQYAAGYEGMTDEEVVALMKKRFAEEVFPQALAAIHPDAAPIPGVEVIYTINFSVYTGVTTAYTIRYRVSAPATFEFIDCDW